MVLAKKDSLRIDRMFNLFYNLFVIAYCIIARYIRLLQ